MKHNYGNFWIDSKTIPGKKKHRLVISVDCLRRPIEVICKGALFQRAERELIERFLLKHYDRTDPEITKRSILHESRIEEFVRAVYDRTRRVYHWQHKSTTRLRHGSGVRIVDSHTVERHKTLFVAEVMLYGLEHARWREIRRELPPAEAYDDLVDIPLFDDGAGEGTQNHDADNEESYD